MSEFDPAAFDDFEAEAWDRPGMARRYDAFLAHITDRLIEPLLDAAGVGAGGRVVDVGCGPGHAAARAAARGARVVGVDGSAEMVSHAAATVPHVLFCRADGRHLPLPASSVDAVVGNFVIFHIGEPELAIAEFGRVLAPGGRVALTRWDAPERCRLLGVLVEAAGTANRDRPSSVPDGACVLRAGRGGRRAARLGWLGRRRGRAGHVHAPGRGRRGGVARAPLLDGAHGRGAAGAAARRPGARPRRVHVAAGAVPPR